MQFGVGNPPTQLCCWVKEVKTDEISGSNDESSFLDIARCSLVGIYRRFRGACKVVSTSETSVFVIIHGATSQKADIFKRTSSPMEATARIETAYKSRALRSGPSGRQDNTVLMQRRRPTGGRHVVWRAIRIHNATD
jgi:hypothetical protein